MEQLYMFGEEHVATHKMAYFVCVCVCVCVCVYVVCVVVVLYNQIWYR